MPLPEVQIEYYEHQVLLAASKFYHTISTISIRSCMFSVGNVAWLSYDTLIHLDLEVRYSQ